MSGPTRKKQRVTSLHSDALDTDVDVDVDMDEETLYGSVRLPSLSRQTCTEYAIATPVGGRHSKAYNSLSSGFQRWPHAYKSTNTDNLGAHARSRSSHAARRTSGTHDSSTPDWAHHPACNSSSKRACRCRPDTGTEPQAQCEDTEGDTQRHTARSEQMYALPDNLNFDPCSPSIVLARNSKPIQASPTNQNPTLRHPGLHLSDVEDGPEPVAPRLSMPLDDMYEDDSFQEAPPRQSLLPDLPAGIDTDTIQSLEFGRRAISEDPRAMFTSRLSGRFADLNDLGLDGHDFEVDGTFINQRVAMDPDRLLQEAIEDVLDDTTTDIRASAGRRPGSASDVDSGLFGDPEDPDEPTFRFTIPQRIQASTREERLGGIQSNDDVDVDVTLDDYYEAPDVIVQDDNVDTATGGLDVEEWGSDHGDVDDVDLQAYREEASAIDRTVQIQSPERPAAEKERPRRQRRELKISRAGHEFPSFPAATVKRLASGFAKSQGGNAKIGKDSLAVLVQTTDWFFEQMGEDLAAYAQHARRKTIEESDVVALMKRQRQITNNNTSFSLAQKTLPRELLQMLRMEPVPKLKGQKRKRLETIDEEEEEQAG